MHKDALIMEAECTPTAIKFGENHPTTLATDSCVSSTSPSVTISSFKQTEKVDVFTDSYEHQLILPRYSEQAKLLSGMGFHLDHATLEELMDQVDGSVEEAVTKLVCQ